MLTTKYERDAVRTAIYPAIGRNVVYPTLGLAGEVGELCNKIKKLLRDKGYDEGAELSSVLTDSEIGDLQFELGDIVWYVAMVAMELQTDLGSVMAKNLAKLSSRAKRGTLGGKGDER